MRNVIDNVKLTISMFLIGATILFIGTSIFMPELTIKIFQFKPYRVVTNTMEPYYNPNDLVLITKFNIEEAEVGDIITFKADIDYDGKDEMITHYIYSIDYTSSEPLIMTNRHFASNETIAPDTWLISASDVVGSTTIRIPYVGIIFGFLISPFGIGVIVINVSLIGGIKYLNKKDRASDEMHSSKNKTQIQI